MTNFLPYTHMNCQTLTAKKHDKIMGNEQYIAQNKYKGIRAALFVQNGEGTLMTRGGHYEPITKNFPHITHGSHLAGLEDCVLDGELWAPGYRDETIAGFANGIYRDTKDTFPIAFNVFDVLCAWGTDATRSILSSRLAVLKIMSKHFNGPLLPVASFGADLHKLALDQIWSQGGEGIVLKNLNSIYHQCPNGKRPPVDTWYKLKSVKDFDVIVIGRRPGEGKFEGLIGSLEIGMYYGDIIHPVGHVSGFTDHTREILTNDFDSWLNTTIEVLAAEQDPRSGKLIEPRFVRRRFDKDPKECVWEDPS